MNLPQALEIVKDHIRIGKGMELINGVPEALEMVVKELEVTQKALENVAKGILVLFPYGTLDLPKNRWIKAIYDLAKEGVPDDQ